MGARTAGGQGSPVRRVPARGDIWNIDLEPVRGSEQRGARSVLVLTRESFNRRGLIWACPVTQGGEYARDAGFAVSLSGCGADTQGVVLTHQARVLDWKDRDARFIEALPDYIVEEGLARVAAMLK